MSGAARSRLSEIDRREQLLDVAADLIIRGGAGAITMEGLAEAAGVSKALPYAHFDNANDVLAELYDREVNQLGGRILEATEPVEPGEQRLVVAIRTLLPGRRGARRHLLGGRRPRPHRGGP